MRSDAEWRAILEPEAYRVLRRSGTEAPRTSPYEHPPANPAGVYRCLGCGAELFRADDQFDSRTGWPSFTSAATPDAVDVRTDFAMLVPRREATCTRRRAPRTRVRRRSGAHGPAMVHQRGRLTLDGPTSAPAPGQPD